MPEIKTVGDMMNFLEDKDSEAIFRLVADDGEYLRIEAVEVNETLIEIMVTAEIN